MTYTPPILTVDIALLAMIEGRLSVALMQRAAEPFLNTLAMPGGYVHTDTDANTDQSALRILRDKLGFTPNYLEQVVTEAGPDRDPRGYSASVVYMALEEAAVLQELAGNGKVDLFDVAQLPPLAFDHTKLLALAVERLKAKAAYSSVAAHLLPKEFTLAQLQSILEALLGKPINAANFRRKILDREVLSPISTSHGRGRPAQAYALKAPVSYFDRQMA